MFSGQPAIFWIVIEMVNEITERDLTDLNDATNMLREISSATDINNWIVRWQEHNTECDKDSDWHNRFPSIGDITISSDIIDGVLQIWVEKNFFIDGKVIKLAQQVF